MPEQINVPLDLGPVIQQALYNLAAAGGGIRVWVDGKFKNYEDALLERGDNINKEFMEWMKIHMPELARKCQYCGAEIGDPCVAVWGMGSMQPGDQLRHVHIGRKLLTTR